MSVLSKKYSFPYVLRLLAFLYIAGAAGLAPAAAQGNLLVTPRRLVFEGGVRMKEMNLANIGKDSARFLISMMEIRMNPDGSFTRIATPDSGQRFASPYLRIYPRSVVIPPGESQMVKVQLMPGAGIDSGEYRSHIYLRAAAPGETDEAGAAAAEGIAVKLNAVFGISIPAIIRFGPNDTRVALGEAEIHKTGPAKSRLAVTLHRSGRMSSYGNLTVTWVSEAGKELQVGIIRGVAIYTPNLLRRIELDLDMSNVPAANGGKLLIRYATDKDDRHPDGAELSLPLR